MQVLYRQEGQRSEKWNKMRYLDIVVVIVFTAIIVIVIVDVAVAAIITVSIFTSYVFGSF